MATSAAANLKVHYHEACANRTAVTTRRFFDYPEQPRPNPGLTTDVDNTLHLQPRLGCRSV